MTLYFDEKNNPFLSAPEVDSRTLEARRKLIRAHWKSILHAAGSQFNSLFFSSNHLKYSFSYINPIIYFKQRHLCGEVGELAGDVPYFHNELIKLPATDDIV